MPVHLLLPSWFSVHEVDEGTEDKEEEKAPLPTLEGALEQLGLTEYTETFQKEKVDFESLVSRARWGWIHVYSDSLYCLGLSAVASQTSSAEAKQ